ncbi:putative transporter [subsurface metagenome]
MEIISAILIFIIFVIILVSYSKEKLDFVSISLLGMILCIVIVSLSTPITFEKFINYIEFKALIVILSMQIITQILQESNILQYVAIRMFRLSRGNQRLFLYIICLTGAILAAVISDVVVALILVPIIIRICNFLKIKAGTYLLALTIVINIGSIFTPFSSGENIIIAQHFQLDTIYFVTYYWLIALILLFLTILFIDILILRKEPKMEFEQSQLIMEILDPSMVITDKKLFIFNGIAFLSIIISFVIIPEIYVVALIAAMIMVLVNNKRGERPLKEILKEINWEIIFFFIALFVVIGCLQIVGIFDLFQLGALQNFNIYIVSLIILLSVSFLSGILANTPTMLLFLPIIDSLIVDYNFSPVPLIFALLIGVNLGGNILPQGAMCDVFTLKIAQENKVENFTFKRLLKNGAIFAGIHILISSVFLIFLCLFFG